MDRQELDEEQVAAEQERDERDTGPDLGSLRAADERRPEDRQEAEQAEQRDRDAEELGVA
jgi:hypothetical protein